MTGDTHRLAGIRLARLALEDDVREDDAVQQSPGRLAGFVQASPGQSHWWLAA